MTRADELELAGLVGRAWERRATADFDAALGELLDWWDRRYVRALERVERRRAFVLAILRETRGA